MRHKPLSRIVVFATLCAGLFGCAKDLDTPPKVEIIYPLNGGAYARYKPLPVTVSFYDEDGLQNVNVTITRRNLGTIAVFSHDLGGSKEFYLDTMAATNSPSNGEFSITARGTDVNGKEKTVWFRFTTSI